MNRREFLTRAAAIPCAVAGVAMMPTPAPDLYFGDGSGILESLPQVTFDYSRDEIRRMYQCE